MSSTAGPILGTWYSGTPSGGTDAIAFTFLADGTFLVADKGTHEHDPSGQSGLEWGTYTWDQGTGAFSATPLVNTDGEWGLSHSGAVIVTVANDILTLTGAEGSMAFARMVSPPATIVGSWYGASPGGGTDQIVFTFLEDGTFLVADKGTHAHDPSGDSGIEWGTYAWNSGTGELSVNVTVNTDGQWGFSDSGGSLIVHVTDQGLAVGGPDLVLQRVSGIADAAAPAVHLVGTQGNETLAGTTFNDTFTGLGGNDSIDGGDGTDSALYGGVRSNYTLASVPNGMTVTSHNGAEGVDTLAHVERLLFADRNVALDVLDGHAGIAAKIIGAVFGADQVDVREYMGIGIALLDGGMSYENLFTLALDARLGGLASDNGVVVDLLYTHLAGVAPSLDEHNYYTGLLDDHTLTIAQLGVLAAESPYNLFNIDLTGRAATGIEYA